MGSLLYHPSAARDRRNLLVAVQGRLGGTERDAPFVMASLVWSDTSRGERPFVPGSASIASELARLVTAIGCPGSRSP
jgi:hypothetical protein